MKRVMHGSAVLMVSIGFWAGSATGTTFQLLSWNADQASDSLPSAVGKKPSNSAPNSGDWLVFTTDDLNAAGAMNPAGALSHNLVDPSGTFGQTNQFGQAVSLSGTLELNFSPAVSGSQPVNISALQYSGVAAPGMTMDQYLLTSAISLPVAGGPDVNVDGSSNSGTWANTSGNWSISYSLDSYFDASIDTDQTAPTLVFDNAVQHGYLLPKSIWSSSGTLTGLGLPNQGFYSGGFSDYLTQQIVPRLPDDADYLLITQMDKTQPVWAKTGLPISSNSWVGNFTIAYSVVPEPATAGMMGLVLAGWALRRRRSSVNGW
ncbi:MAG: PEP-CTERM sorting domain-containing protein [Phycisphaerales bacterium]|nr:PEP-CTERM sorting domain-containing protein [Phycisphaerales bacterium]